MHSETFTIFARFINHNLCLPVHVNPDANLGDLKACILDLAVRKGLKFDLECLKMSVQGKFLTQNDRKIASISLRDKSTIEVYTKSQMIGGMNSDNDKSDVLKLLKNDDNRAEDTLPPIKGA